MSPSKVLRKIFLDRIAWVDRMVSEIRSLPFMGRELGDVTKIRTAFLGWLDSHSDMADGSL